MGRTLLLEVWSGPDAGLAFALPAGARAVVGRMAPSDALLPGDRTVSRRHFAISFDGRAATIEDLCSSHGTTVNDRPVDSATVLHGDRIGAGETTLRARLVDVAPAHARPLGPRPTAAPTVAPAAPPGLVTEDFPLVDALATPAAPPAPHDRALQALRGEPAPLFAILDAARDPMVYLRIHECPERKQSLYEDAAPELAFVAPYLISLPRSSPSLDLIVREGWGESWGVFLTSDRTFEEVRKHLRRLLTVQTEDGKPLLFRFYDPRVLRAFLPTCTPVETTQLHGPIGAFLIEGDSPGRLLRWPSRGVPGGGPDVVDVGPNERPSSPGFAGGGAGR